MKKRLFAFAMAAVMMFGSAMTVCAAEDATVTFTGKQKLEYSGVTKDENGTKLSDAFQGIAPGETREQTIKVLNDNNRTVDFYMDATAISALEETGEQAQGAGYDIKLTAGDAVLYDSKVGGYADSTAQGSKEGLLEMNDGALEGFVYIGTLAKGESENVTLSIYFDGEAMDNDSQSIDYSNTFGQLGFSFRVAYEDPQSPTVVYKDVTKKGATNYVTKVVEIIEERVPLAAVATGDYAMVGFAVVVVGFGIALILLAGRKPKHKNEEK